MTDTDESAALAEAYERGCDRGWSHSNFVDAYGSEHDTPKRDVATPYEEIGDGHPLYYSFTSKEERWEANALRRRQRAEFLRGWSDGRRRFSRGLYPDGTKISD